MSGPQYAPGTVAVATVRGVPNVRVVRVPRRDELPWMQITGRYSWASDDEVTDVRPLVVLDPDNSDQVEALTDALKAVREATLSHVPLSYDAMRMREALLAQTRPPKPDEPQALGAVVKDRNGTKWIAIGNGQFAHEHHGGSAFLARYDDVDAVDLMWPGVAP